jgi:hypothetical protein
MTLVHPAKRNEFPHSGSVGARLMGLKVLLLVRNFLNRSCAEANFDIYPETDGSAAAHSVDRR